MNPPPATAAENASGMSSQAMIDACLKHSLF